MFQKPVGLLNQMPLEYLHFTQSETLKVFWKGSQNQMIQALLPVLINIDLIIQLTTEKQPQNSRAHKKMNTEGISLQSLFWSYVKQVKMK